MRKIGEVEVVDLSIEDARQMSDEELRTNFVDFVSDLRVAFREDALSANFPRNPDGMSRAEILAAVEEHQDWFNPPEPESLAGEPDQA